MGQGEGRELSKVVTQALAYHVTGGHYQPFGLPRDFGEGNSDLEEDLRFTDYRS